MSRTNGGPSLVGSRFVMLSEETPEINDSFNINNEILVGNISRIIVRGKTPVSEVNQGQSMQIIQKNNSGKTNNNG